MDILCPRTSRIMARVSKYYRDLALPYTDYTSGAGPAAADHLLYRMLRKYEGEIRDTLPSDPLDRKAFLEKEAVTSFIENERRLDAVSFETITTPLLSDVGPKANVRLESDFLRVVLNHARGEILSCLGRFDLAEYSRSCGMTSGASTSQSRRNGHPSNKWRGKLHVTRNCALLAAHFLWDNEVCRQAMFRRYGYGSVPSDWVTVVNGSEQFSVPKTSTSVRLAAKEPDLNLILQKGIGNMIRRRLKLKGIDLDDNTKNKHYARIGSRTGSLATIDLSNASDNIHLGLVKALLPDHWYRYIWYTRSPCMRLLDGSTVELVKVSTMGNGFTFELESLIFWALARGVQKALRITDTRLAVYGDDIVIHHGAFEGLSQVLTTLGMVVNHDKSFATGPYRESCGGYYYMGADLQPFHVRKPIQQLGDACKLANDILLFSSVTGVEPPWKILNWMFLGEFNKIPPVVPFNLDPRSGLKWWPTRGVTFCLAKSSYRYERLVRVHKQVTKVLTDGSTYLVNRFLEHSPGVVDPGFSEPRRPPLRTLLYDEESRVERRQGTRGSQWDYPPYPHDWLWAIFA